MLKRLLLGTAVSVGLAIGLALALTSPQANMLLGGTSGPPPSGAAWNPADKDAAVVLTTTSTTNDTATQSGAVGAFKMVRATAPSYTVGTNHKVIFNVQVVAASTAGGSAGEGTVIGVATSAASLTYPGNTSVGWGTEGGTGGDYQNGTQNITSGCSGAAGNFINYVTGDTIWVAIDFNTGFVQCAQNGCTNWFAAAGAGRSPDAGTFSATTLPAGTYFIAWAGNNFGSVNDVGVLNAAPSLGGCTNVTTFHTWNAG